MEIARVFLDQDMRCNFPGIQKTLRKALIKPETLSEKSFIVFLNSKGTKFKLLVGTSYLIYYTNGNRPIPLEAISHLPSCFEGKRFDFSRAVSKTLEGKLPKGMIPAIKRSSSTTRAEH